MLDVSIYIPSYNGSKYLQRCLESVVNQRLDNFECIVVNDGSTDNTIEVFNRFKFADDGTDRYPWLKILTLKQNSGISIARNEGIKAAEGFYLFGLDVDDTIPEGAVRRLLEAAHANGCPDMVLGQIAIISRNGTEIVGGEKAVVNTSVPRYLVENIHESAWAPHWGHLVKRQLIIDSNVWYIPHLAKNEDYEMSYRLINHLKSIAKIDEVVYNYYLVESSAMGTFKKQGQLEATAVFQKTKSRAIETIYSGTDKLPEAMRDVQFFRAFQWMSNIYVIYLTKGINRFHWLKTSWKAADENMPEWKTYMHGLPGILIKSARLGLWAPHLCLSVASQFPSFKKKMRG